MTEDAKSAYRIDREARMFCPEICALIDRVFRDIHNMEVDGWENARIIIQLGKSQRCPSYTYQVSHSKDFYGDGIQGGRYNRFRKCIIDLSNE